MLVGLPSIYHYRNGPFPLNRLTDRGAAQGNALDYLIYAQCQEVKEAEILDYQNHHGNDSHRVAVKKLSE